MSGQWLIQKNRLLELKSIEYEHEKGKRYRISIKVIGIFSSDTIKIFEAAV